MNLVKYFRFTTKTNQIAVTIAEEMEHMESYIKIQQVRFPERVTYEIDISEGRPSGNSAALNSAVY